MKMIQYVCFVFLWISKTVSYLSSNLIRSNYANLLLEIIYYLGT